jgi:hypothetical protein
VTGAARQLLALLALRWSMVRSTSAKLGLLLLLGSLAVLLEAVVHAVPFFDEALLITAAEVAPEAFVGFAALAMIAPLTAGGSSHLVPPDDLVAFPVRPATHFLSGLLLAPANLVWVLQLLGLAGLTAALSAGGAVLPGLLTAVAFVLVVTVAGQCVAWLFLGLRQTRWGRRIIFVTAAAAVVAVVLAARTPLGPGVVRLLPARQLAKSIEAGSRGDLSGWAPMTVVLVLIAVAGLLAGSRLCGWAMRRPGDDRADRSARPVTRRAAHATMLGELLAADRASVWRAPALRRGLLLLTILPAGVAVAGGFPWASIVILPALITAGAGLLFGINAFALDGSGAMFTAGLPVPPRLLFLSKALAVGEVVLGTAAVTVAAAALRAPSLPTTTELVATVTSLVACTAVVVALCLRSSLLRPHRAELRGVRDAVAPPGVMAVASLRLAFPTVLVALLIGGSIESRTWWLAPALSAPVVLLSLRSVWASARRYDRPAVRARVVLAVSSG